MNINYLQSRLNRLKRAKKETKIEMDKAYSLYNQEPTEENLEAWEMLRKKHCALGDSVSRARNKLNRARG